MGTVATVSLAIIAATCIIAVGALVVLAVYLWRVLARVEAMLALVQRSLPGLIAETRAMINRADREILGEVARTVTQLSAVVGTGITVVEQAQTTARRVAQTVIGSQVANAMGVLAVIREGLGWFRSHGDGKRR
jgi:uncharacterized protein YoxC